MTTRTQPLVKAVTLQSAAAATGNGTALDVAALGYAALGLQVTGTFVGTITFEGTVDDSNWVAVQVVNRNDGTLSTTATTTGLFYVPIAGLSQFRARVSAYTSGTITVKGEATTVAGDSGVADVSGPTGTSANQVQGTAADGATAVGNPVQVGGVDGSSNAQAMLMGTDGRPAMNISQVAGASASSTNGASDSLGANSGLIVAAYTLAYNGSSWDRVRANHEVTALSSAARTTSTDSSDLTNYNARGAVVVIDVTAIAASPSIVVTIQGKSSLGSDYYTILASAAITGTGTTVLRVYPGLTTAANLTANDILPRVWRVSVAHGNADSITYSIAANLVN